VLFVLGLAGSAFAIHAEIPEDTQSIVAKGTTQVTVGGNIMLRGETRNNTTDFNGDVGDHMNLYNARVRLLVDAKVADNVSGRIHLENGTYTWGEDNAAAGIYTMGNSKRDDIELLEGWINYNFGPAAVKVGHMPLALGNKIFFDHTKYGDDAIVFYADPNENVHVGVLTAKFEENSGTDNSDDADAYVALVVYKGEGFGVSGDITMVKDGDQDGTYCSAAAEECGVQVYNVGVRGHGTVGPVTLKGDIEGQFGELDSEVGVGGMAALFGASASLGAVNLSGELAYGSGDDDGEDFDAYITSHNSDGQYVMFVYDSRVRGASGATDAGLSNLMYLKLVADSDVSETVNVKGAMAYMMAAEDTNLNGGELDDEVGIEIDAKATVKLAKNLKYWVEAGYFLTGAIYEDADGTADDAYALRHGIVLSF
jgi:hypothetical protein